MSSEGPEAAELIGREHITCDGPGCEASRPTKRCSKCKRTFYCSVECQKVHWKKEHKGECRDINWFREQQVADVAGVVENADAGACKKKAVAQNSCCFICLEDPISDPYIIPGCGHSFCFGCLQNWQGFTKNERKADERGRPVTCPACRADAPDIEETVLDKAHTYACRANKNGLEEADKLELREKAISELNMITKSKDKETEINALVASAEVLLSLERPQEACDILQEVLGMHEKREGKIKRMDELFLQAADPNISDEDYDRVCNEMDRLSKEKDSSLLIGNVLDVYEKLARSKEAMGDWSGAEEIYSEKMLRKITDPTVVSAPLQRMMWMGLSRCMYHLGEYDMAIKAGSAAIKMNRHFPQVYKYVALSQKAKGDLAEAKKTMARAVNYETPWDDENKKEVLRLYQALMEETG